MQGDWVADTINYCENNKKKTVDSTALAEAKWTKTVEDLWNASLFKFTESWYIGASPSRVSLVNK